METRKNRTSTTEAINITFLHLTLFQKIAESEGVIIIFLNNNLLKFCDLLIIENCNKSFSTMLVKVCTLKNNNNNNKKKKFKL